MSSISSLYAIESVEELKEKTTRWEYIFQDITEEISFLKQFLTSDIFGDQNPDIYEKLHRFYEELDSLKSQKIDLHTQLHNHKNDLNGMAECEDINCEAFYQSQHHILEERITEYLKSYQELKISIFRFTPPLLRKNS